MEKYKQMSDAAENHCKSLIEKYGKEAVSDIRYTDKKITKSKYSPKTFRTMNEKTNSLTDYAVAGALSIAATGTAAFMKTPIIALYAPVTTGDKAKQVERERYKRNLR